MKTISVRELHNDTAKWLRAVKDEEEIVVTNRGIPIVKFVPISDSPKKRKTWAERTLLPGYAALVKAGKLKSTGDSTAYILEDRTSRDNSVAGIEE